MACHIVKYLYHKRRQFLEISGFFFQFFIRCQIQKWASASEIKQFFEHIHLSARCMPVFLGSIHQHPQDRIAARIHPVEIFDPGLRCHLLIRCCHGCFHSHREIPGFLFHLFLRKFQFPERPQHRFCICQISGLLIDIGFHQLLFRIIASEVSESLQFF